MGDKKIAFNKKSSRWLGVWFNNKLKLTSHINKKIKRAYIAKIQIKSVIKAHGVILGLI